MVDAHGGNPVGIVLGCQLLTGPWAHPKMSLQPTDQNVSGPKPIVPSHSEEDVSTFVPTSEQVAFEEAVLDNLPPLPTILSLPHNSQYDERKIDGPFPEQQIPVGPGAHLYYEQELLHAEPQRRSSVFYIRVSDEGIEKLSCREAARRAARDTGPILTAVSAFIELNQKKGGPWLQITNTKYIVVQAVEPTLFQCTLTAKSYHENKIYEAVQLGPNKQAAKTECYADILYQFMNDGEAEKPGPQFPRRTNIKAVLIIALFDIPYIEQPCCVSGFALALGIAYLYLRIWICLLRKFGRLIVRIGEALKPGPKCPRCKRERCICGSTAPHQSRKSRPLRAPDVESIDGKYEDMADLVELTSTAPSLVSHKAPEKPKEEEAKVTRAASMLKEHQTTMVDYDHAVSAINDIERREAALVEMTTTANKGAVRAALSTLRKSKSHLCKIIRACTTDEYSHEEDSDELLADAKTPVASPSSSSSSSSASLLSSTDSSSMPAPLLSSTSSSSTPSSSSSSVSSSSTAKKATLKKKKAESDSDNELDFMVQTRKPKTLAEMLRVTPESIKEPTHQLNPVVLDHIQDGLTAILLNPHALPSEIALAALDNARKAFTQFALPIATNGPAMGGYGGGVDLRAQRGLVAKYAEAALVLEQHICNHVMTNSTRDARLLVNKFGTVDIEEAAAAVPAATQPGWLHKAWDNFFGILALFNPWTQPTTLTGSEILALNARSFQNGTYPIRPTASFLASKHRTLLTPLITLVLILTLTPIVLSFLSLTISGLGALTSGFSALDFGLRAFSRIATTGPAQTSSAGYGAGSSWSDYLSTLWRGKPPLLLCSDPTTLRNLLTYDPNEYQPSVERLGWIGKLARSVPNWLQFWPTSTGAYIRDETGESCVFSLSAKSKPQTVSGLAGSIVNPESSPIAPISSKVFVGQVPSPSQNTLRNALAPKIEYAMTAGGRPKRLAHLFSEISKTPALQSITAIVQAVEDMGEELLEIPAINNTVTLAHQLAVAAFNNTATAALMAFNYTSLASTQALNVTKGTMTDIATTLQNRSAIWWRGYSFPQTVVSTIDLISASLEKVGLGAQLTAGVTFLAAQQASKFLTSSQTAEITTNLTTLGVGLPLFALVTGIETVELLTNATMKQLTNLNPFNETDLAILKRMSIFNMSALSNARESCANGISVLSTALTDMTHSIINANYTNTSASAAQLYGLLKNHSSNLAQALAGTVSSLNVKSHIINLVIPTPPSSTLLPTLQWAILAILCATLCALMVSHRHGLMSKLCWTCRQMTLPVLYMRDTLCPSLTILDFLGCSVVMIACVSLIGLWLML